MRPCQATLDVPKNKLGLRGEPGFFPAYHMNRDSWITAALNGSVSDDKIKMLLDVSDQVTAPEMRKKKG